jgi:hypothetical protein
VSVVSRLGAVLLAALLLAGGAPVANATADLASREAFRELQGVRFAERVEVGGQDLTLRGLGLLRWRALFKGYVAALYLDPGTPAEAVLGDVPKRLEIEYFWSIGGRAFGEAADRLLARSLDPAALAALRPRLDEVHRLYRDVEPGDRYSLTYLPGDGLELALNGEPLGRVPGADLAAAYFGIWLGPEPIDASLRRELLAGI